ncbi:2'-5' RNA ligase family protein [Mycobacterium vicinigordonae]|uniref:2'-5' RNA ligase family protein n=1 Tax=Mycobacterium vicinigordonae TaxID=1719132 RepID=A0A7D6IBL7_9MYCO|nr:2'-5' RNA ligase family protein [Mycobacterium vicinigordonae]QLL09677.1 2'-5' RNA ligase family protein [Mycobacterium vicinigordonae]
MAHSLELLFEPDTEAAIRGIWDKLAAAQLAGRAAAGRPHVTLIAAEHIEPAVDQQLTPITGQLPLPCAIGAPVIFGRGTLVLARLVVPTRELLDLHAEVHRLSSGHLTPMPNSRPGQWTAHVTLARRVPESQLGRAVRIAGPPMVGSFAGLRRWDGDQRVEYPLG